MKEVTIHSKIRNLGILVTLLIMGGGIFVAFSLSYFHGDMDQIRKIMESSGHFNMTAGLEAKFTTLALYLKYFTYFIIAVSFSIAFLCGALFMWLNNSLTKVIKEVIHNLNTAYLQVDKMANNVAESSQKLSSSTTEQAASLQETASSIQEISAMVTKNSESALFAQELSSTSQSQLNSGQHQVQEMIKVVGEIEESNKKLIEYIHKSHDEFREINNVISEISNKTNVINEIVFQTKLLSFNASVEAARAGEHGKGFAIVAEEVGNLAEMSGNSAKEISDMLGMSIEKVNNIINQTQDKMNLLLEDGREKILSGTEKAQQTAIVLREILHTSGEVNEKVQEISTASQEQAEGVLEVTKAISELDNATQQNMVISQENLSYSYQLQTSSNDLNKLLDQLEKLTNKPKKSVTHEEVEIHEEDKETEQVQGHDTKAGQVASLKDAS